MQQNEEKKIFLWHVLILIQKKGDLWFVDSGCSNHGKIKQLDNVQFVPDSGYNLLSVGQLMTREHSVLFNDNTCVITHKKSGHKVQIA